MLRPGRLGAPFSVPPLTRPPPPRPLLLGFHRRELSLGDLLNRSCVGGPTGLKIFPVTSVGPLISFGFLLIPALTAHLFARNMRQLTIIASLLGGVIAFIGFWLAYQWDLPIGPTEVVLLGLVYAVASGVHQLMRIFKKEKIVHS